MLKLAEIHSFSMHRRAARHQCVKNTGGRHAKNEGEFPPNVRNLWHVQQRAISKRKTEYGSKSRFQLENIDLKSNNQVLR